MTLRRTPPPSLVTPTTARPPISVILAAPTTVPPAPATAIPLVTTTMVDCTDSWRPESGAELSSGIRGGLGELTVENGGDQDATVALVAQDHSELLLKVYLRSGESAGVGGIPTDTYRVLFAHGTAWDGERFQCRRSASEFEEPLIFNETYDASGIYWDRWTISLQPVPDGTAEIEALDPGTYDAITSG